MRTRARGNVCNYTKIDCVLLQRLITKIALEQFKSSDFIVYNLL